ncbi:16S rRNA (cytidine(1402)-2'-O)-methyltransferase [Terribacillus saccharophilus]|uniref:Ribosomal RNA small subunit methyltransferase I n=1 Tax=Terribacillus saccharophilus TaxID=361277 RepID=A0A268A6G7_9BACI|nr:16S rRNA (cytidine(1402)-2'-O)-methyltransferase [Terribacillus saccharophilus]PAD19701.1 16S rRNA (cytidine(1402)-2'-O)-methyltransferase [Terribacillus saccharophilus]PAF20092.1 16S rRNA (cytidine(1402)-2'-O)-methyltransferase [Terribacillus saccharophilus]PAF34608.1 16S rRNA (cytidine(1402)-2'-O)-methyltransferase [Terribacillus saccharophilus]PAF35183.1 16S rRNA (cytidine(1402)-2'-O)-methyltransferase [Terribacillus saccharophilus]
MQSQKSFEEHQTGTLFIIPTPIGNLQDITLRALETLKQVHTVAAEDTRNTKKLFNHFEIPTPLISYHEHNRKAREQMLLDLLEEGKDVGLVSDAGMPAISDPGQELVQAAAAADYPVVVLPGANAALVALVGSGLSTDAYQFYGFLPRKKKELTGELEKLRKVGATLIFYESPHRLKETLAALKEVFGNRRIALGRELTKRYEEFLRGTIQEAKEWASSETVRGEFCLVVEGASEAEQIEEVQTFWQDMSVQEHVNWYIENEELPSKQAIKQVAVDRQLPKRDVYQAYHVE